MQAARRQAKSKARIPQLSYLPVVNHPWQALPAEPAEPVRFTQKEIYLTVLICGGFLYFSALGVWLTQREVSKQQPESAAKTTAFIPREHTQAALPSAGTVPAADWSMESHQALIDAYGDQERLSAIDGQLARKYDALYRLQEKEKFNQQVLPPPNWALLRGNWASMPLSH